MTATTHNPRKPAAIDGDALGPNWERNDAIVGARLGDLIAGLDSIASFAIPYARLPRRLGAYATEFPRWSDIASHTPQALLTRPKLGAAAVRALILAGRESVRVRRLVDQLDDFDRAILSAQVWALDPISQREVAEQFGVHQVSVTRNLPRARARFAELLADPAHREVGEHADELRGRLGPYVPETVAHVELRRLGVDDPSSQTAQVLLHVAGPYARRDRWIESATEAVMGGARAEATIDGIIDAEIAPSTDVLLGALTSLGMPTAVALTYLESLALKRFGDRWVRWSGNSTANMAEAALRVIGAPAPADVILNAIGPDGGSLDNVNRVLSRHDRFVRVTRTTWGLRAWGFSEYISIAHAIGERIDAHGGQATVADVTADLLASYPDITESSIRTYLSTVKFVITGGSVRRRTDADGWPPVPPVRAARGAFHDGVTGIRLAIPVNPELLRGSGRHIHPAVATAAGLTPGHHRTFTSRHGQFTLSWSLASTSGATIGSLRPLTAAVQATTGDMLVLALRPDVASLDVTRLGSNEVGISRLRKLLGRRVRNPAAALATALKCQRDDVDAVLRARGDHELADMLDDIRTARRATE